MGLDPCLWGPTIWHFLHIISFNYPEYPTYNEQMNMLSYLTFLGTVLPCPECRDHYVNNIKTVNVNGKQLNDCLESRELFSKWIYNLHDAVNKQTGKTISPTYESVKFKYSGFSSNSCTESCNGTNNLVCKVVLMDKNEGSRFENFSDTTGSYVMLVIIILVFLFFIYYNKNVSISI